MLHVIIIQKHVLIVLMKGICTVGDIKRTNILEQIFCIRVIMREE